VTRPIYHTFAILLCGALAGCPAEKATGEAGLVPSAMAHMSDVGAAADGVRDEPVTRWVSGYYVGYQRDMYRPADIEWRGLTHIIMGRIKVRDDATLVTDFDVDAVNGPALAREIAARAHKAGRRAILMLGGAGQGAEIRQSSGPTLRARFVGNLVKAMADYGYDGLDLDWEDHLDLDLFLALVNDLRAAAPHAILTLPAMPINGNITRSIDPKLVQLANLVDQFNLMSYYPATAYAGGSWRSWHGSALRDAKGSTPVAIEDSFRRYVAAGVAKRKLGMGIAFYAICYTGGVTAPNQSTLLGVSIKGGDNEYPLAELFGAKGAFSPAARRWDLTAECAYLSLATPERHGCRYVSFEDEESIAAKGRFARNNGYGGIIVWTINQGYVRTRPGGDPNFLMQALGKAFIQ